MSKIAVLVHNIRSIHNVGSILRSADGFGIDEVIFSGYTPYPRQENDTRLPHIINKIEKTLHKTALDAENSVKNIYIENPIEVVSSYKQKGYIILALEQASNSVDLKRFKAPEKCLLILGEEVDGINSELLSLADVILEIPMHGIKESFNVSVAAGIAFYQLS